MWLVIANCVCDPSENRMSYDSGTPKAFDPLAATPTPASAAPRNNDDFIALASPAPKRHATAHSPDQPCLGDNELSRPATAKYLAGSLQFCDRNIRGATMSNALMIIKPYWYERTWVFDDPATGLVREPFVAGVPEMINR